MTNNDNNLPAFAFRDAMTPDADYVQWLGKVKQRFKSTQAKAMLKVNTAMLEFYWSIGRDLVAMNLEDKWGKGIIKQFANDMRIAFPNEKGFSDSNVKYMRRWYNFYYQFIVNQQKIHEAEICQQLVGKLLSTDNQNDIIGQQRADQLETNPIIKSQQVADLLEMPESFGKIPWFHHILIISKTNNFNEAVFYINKTIENNWSRSMLESQIKNNLFASQGAAITNFANTLPAPHGQLAQEILKDPYNFEFLAIKEGYDEKQLEDALMSNITRFLLELGKGFAFVGRQMELQMPGGKTFFPDLVFYHTKLKSYIVIELKAVEFTPEFAGKINFYVSAADELLKDETDNPTIGLIICKSSDKTIVEWSFRGMERPIGVATYQLKEVVERTVAELKLKKAQEKYL